MVCAYIEKKIRIYGQESDGDGGAVRRKKTEAKVGG